MDSYIKFLQDSAVSKEVIDTFLDDSQPSWAQFDPELGYRLGNDLPKGGIDGSRFISTVNANGARRSAIYTGVPCRINTYGDSFTACDQVSDHETWQEILAAHFGEPVRNFGMGGYGFYQAYRRMIRTEITADAAEYILLYIWGDDHMRSLLRCRYALIRPWWDSRGGRMFHNNFWAHLEMDLEPGRLVEMPNLLPTPQALYQMTDPDFMVAALRDDWMLQLTAFSQGLIDTLEREPLNRLAEILGCPAIPSGESGKVKESVDQLRNAYAFAATRFTLDRAFDFARQQDKKLMILLFDPGVTKELITTGKRYDQPIIDDLELRGARYFDMNQVHVEDYKSFNLSEDYFNAISLDYNPSGNFLCLRT
jgi:hypothetical protein